MLRARGRPSRATREPAASDESSDTRSIQFDWSVKSRTRGDAEKALRPSNQNGVHVQFMLLIYETNEDFEAARTSSRAS